MEPSLYYKKGLELAVQLSSCSECLRFSVAIAEHKFRFDFSSLVPLKDCSFSNLKAT